MPVRQVACDPCRFAKLACDHAKPCSRCSERGQTANCTYRDRPFKRKRVEKEPKDLTSPEAGVPYTTPPSTTFHQPNPGYLGASSYSTIYARLSPENNGATASAASENIVDDTQIQHGAKLIEHIRNCLQIPLCLKLVQTWIDRGVNLALASPLTEACAHGTAAKLDSSSQESRYHHVTISRQLFASSIRSLGVDEQAVLKNFQADLAQPDNLRWETVAFFFTALSRATMDVVTFEPLYSSSQERLSLRRLAMQLSDSCLEIALSLDCLNDLQLVLQYENAILHSYVDGDQSYHAWRRLGDVISSLLALGYHERIQTSPKAPPFLLALRRAAFARTFSYDKNVAVFLGRPPRLHRKYCNIHPAGLDTQSTQTNGSTVPPLLDFEEWSSAAQFDRTTDTRWSFLCSLCKGDILELRREDSQEERIRKARIIETEAEAQWSSLPSHLRLQDPLKVYDRTPIERDFMVGARLNHLHVMFLLRLAVLRQLPESDSQLLGIANSILKLTVEQILHRDRLKNSGTSLVWRVAYYGLPAAGTICTSLLKGSLATTSPEISNAEVFQNLSVLVAEVESGAFVSFEHPNYVLLSRAVQTIKSVLNRVLSGELQTNSKTNEIASQDVAAEPADWIPWTEETWDFEIDFWRNLAEHPMLTGVDPTLDGFL